MQNVIDEHSHSTRSEKSLTRIATIGPATWTRRSRTPAASGTLTGQLTQRIQCFTVIVPMSQNPRRPVTYRHSHSSMSVCVFTLISYNFILRSKIYLFILCQVAPEQEAGIDPAPVRGQAQEGGHGGSAGREAQLQPLRGRTGELH